MQPSDDRSRCPQCHHVLGPNRRSVAGLFPLAAVCGRVGVKIWLAEFWRSLDRQNFDYVVGDDHGCFGAIDDRRS